MFTLTITKYGEVEYVYFDLTILIDKQKNATIVDNSENDWKDLYEQLSKGIRRDDIAGVLDEKDTHCYVLLTNAGFKDFEIIKDRLHKLGLESEYVEDFEVE